MLEPGEYFGYPVDSGTGCFAQDPPVCLVTDFGVLPDERDP